MMTDYFQERADKVLVGSFYDTSMFVVYKAKRKLIQELVHIRKADIIGLCETHLDEHATAPVVQGYTWFGNDVNGRERGVVIYVSIRLKSSLIKTNGPD